MELTPPVRVILYNYEQRLSLTLYTAKVASPPPTATNYELITAIAFTPPEQTAWVKTNILFFN